MAARQRASDPHLFNQLVAESEAMAKYALASGLTVPASIINLVAVACEDAGPRADMTARIVTAHNQLTHIVAPATPRTLLLLSKERRDARLGFLGPVRLVRHLMLAAIVLLVTFILSAMSSHVTRGSGDIFASSGLDLLVNMVFLLSAAGIGAAFTALFRANRYIANGTYDPKYESSYWVRFILGLIAGIILPSLVPVSGDTFSRPLLALLGGFSASVVYRILSRLVDTLESLFQGDNRQILAAREQTIRMQLADQRAQDQVQLAAVLIKLRAGLDAMSGSEQAKAGVVELLNRLMPLEDDPATPEPDEPPKADRDRPRPVVAS